MNRLAYLLAKWLFPGLPGDLRRRKFNNLLTVLFICLIVMGAIAVAFFLMEKRGR